MKNRINAAMISAYIRVRNMATSKKAASLWEYLLVIAIVCIIGAALINVINGGTGISDLWKKLFAKFSGLVGAAGEYSPTTPTTPVG